jgi:hypothetical protein
LDPENGIKVGANRPCKALVSIVNLVPVLP